MALGWLIGCSGPGIEPSQTGAETTAPDAPAYGYTYGQRSGNRIVESEGDLPNSHPVDVELGGKPAWVVGVPLEEDTAWVVALEDGRLEAFRFDDEAERLPVSPESLPAGAPPLLKVEGGRLEIVAPDNSSPLTHPVPLGEGLIFVGAAGQLLAEPGGDLPVRALPDARPVLDAYGRVAVLSEPTYRYAHGVLGDDREAESISVLNPGEPTVESFRTESGGVFEALAPLWFEPRPRGEELLAITESVEGEGTRVSVYRPDGRLAVAGPFIGEGMRWRHLLAAGPFGPGGEVELAATRTPHATGVIEFYRPDFETGELEILATVPGYATHRIYSRNLDMARAGDLDGDGQWELLVPDESYTQLAAIRRTEGGAQIAWNLPVDGTLATNLASMTDSDGHISIAAGREDGVLRIWP